MPLSKQRTCSPQIHQNPMVYRHSPHRRKKKYSKAKEKIQTRIRIGQRRQEYIKKTRNTFNKQKKTPLLVSSVPASLKGNLFAARHSFSHSPGALSIISKYV